MYEIVKDFPDAIIFEEEGPFISLYQPTHRHWAAASLIRLLQDRTQGARVLIHGGDLPGKPKRLDRNAHK